MRLARLPRCIVHQRVGDRLRIFREIGACGVELRQRVVAGRRTPGDAEGVQAPHKALAGPRTSRDAGILALGVYADHRAVEQQQVGDDRADALARAGGCDR